MSLIRIGATEAHEKTTAKVYFRESGATGFEDIGNVMSYKDGSEIQYRQHQTATGGARVVDDEQPDTIHLRWEFVLTESGDLLNRLANLSGEPSTGSQSAVSAPSGTASIASIVLGRTYVIGSTGLITPTVKVSTVTVPPADYVLDPFNGLITFKEDAGTLVNGDTVDLTFGTPARAVRTYTGNGQILFRGTIRIEEKNQLSAEPLRIIEGEATIALTAFPEQTGEFGKSTLRVTFTAAPAVTRRAAA